MCYISVNQGLYYIYFINQFTSCVWTTQALSLLLISIFNSSTSAQSYNTTIGPPGTFHRWVNRRGTWQRISQNNSNNYFFILLKDRKTVFFTSKTIRLFSLHLYITRESDADGRPRSIIVPPPRRRVFFSNYFRSAVVHLYVLYGYGLLRWKNLLLPINEIEITGNGFFSRRFLMYDIICFRCTRTVLYTHYVHYIVWIFLWSANAHRERVKNLNKNNNTFKAISTVEYLPFSPYTLFISTANKW